MVELCELNEGTRVRHTLTDRRGSIAVGCFGTPHVQWDGTPGFYVCDRSAMLKVLEVVPAHPDDRIKFNGRWRSRLDAVLSLRKKLGRRATATHDPARACYVLTAGTAVFVLHGFPEPVAALEGK